MLRFLRQLACLALAVSAALSQTAPAETQFAEQDSTEKIAEGISYRFRRIVKPEGPFTFHILEVDPSHPAINLLPVHALDHAIGKETVSAMAKRHGATVGVNGGYFVVSGPYAGTSNGVYQLHGDVLSSGANRTALLLCEETDYRERTAIDVVNFHGAVTAADGASASIVGLNRPRAAGELVLYRPAIGPRTLTGAGGVEVIVDAAGRVDRIVEDGNAEIPERGAVLSGVGAAATWLREHIKPGSTPWIEARLDPSTPAEKSGCRPTDIIGGGPNLVRDGKIHVTQEGFMHQTARHPRTAFAVTGRGTYLFVTLDGRQPSSLGMKPKELAAELIALGAVEAMNLDGGGSSALFAAGKTRNSISDRQERPVSDGILIFSIPTVAALADVFESLAQGQIAPALAARIRTSLGAARDLDAVLRIVSEAPRNQITPAATRVLTEGVRSLATASPAQR